MRVLESRFKVVDNTGIKYLRILQTLSKANKIHKIGDILVTTILKKKKKLHKNFKKLVRNKINKALILTTKNNFLRKDGSIIKFDETTVILFTKIIRGIDMRDPRRKINFKVNVPAIKEFKMKKLKKVIYMCKNIY